MREVNTAAIALGSNLPSAYGGPEENLRIAVERLSGLGHVIAVSSVHVTQPVGFVDQPVFVNSALLLETEVGPLDLLQKMLGIELAMGRVRASVPPKGPRIIDLDLILFDSLVIEMPELRLPHPAMAERAFVLAPLAEIAPDWSHPCSGQTVREMLERLKTGGPLPPLFAQNLQTIGLSSGPPFRKKCTIYGAAAFPGVGFGPSTGVAWRDAGGPLRERTLAMV